MGKAWVSSETFKSVVPCGRSGNKLLCQSQTMETQLQFVGVESVGNASDPQPLPIICQVPLPTPSHNWARATSVAINSHLDVNMRAANVRPAQDFDR